MKLGSECVGSHAKLCAKLGWDSQSNTCRPESVSLANVGVEQFEGVFQNFTNVRFFTSYIKVCPAVVPSTCNDCMKLGPECVGSHAKSCVKMGWDQSSNQCNSVSLSERKIFFELNIFLGVSSCCSNYLRGLYCIGKTMHS